MADFLSAVDERTQLAGNNRMELLTFNLAGPQKYGINVFKVREVMLCPEMSEVTDVYIKGIVHLRGSTFSVIDLNQIVHQEPLPMENSFLIISEFTQTRQGFVVRSVDRILNLAWDEIHPPPSNINQDSFVTATTYQNNELVQILDVEKVLDRIAPQGSAVDDKLIARGQELTAETIYEIVICDDSSVARRNLIDAIEQVGCHAIVFENGLEAYEYLIARERSHEGLGNLLMLISDIEMPEMDGFTLIARLRQEPEYTKMPMYMHSSLSGDVNEVKAGEMGADGFINKFDANEVAKILNRCMLNRRDTERQRQFTLDKEDAIGTSLPQQG